MRTIDTLRLQPGPRGQGGARGREDHVRV